MTPGDLAQMSPEEREQYLWKQKCPSLIFLFFFTFITGSRLSMHLRDTDKAVWAILHLFFGLLNTHTHIIKHEKESG
jgi:hypothetical protein